MGNGDINKAIEALLKLWPKNLAEPEEVVRARLRGKVAESLPLTSLRTIPAGEWTIPRPALVHSGVARCLLVDGSYPNTRVMTEFHLQPDGWLLMAFDAECPLCFGTGVNNGCICDLCFGKGWGTHIQ